MAVLIRHLTLPKRRLEWENKPPHTPLGLLPASSVSNCYTAETPPAMENWARLQLSHCWWASGKSGGAGSRAERQPSTARSGRRAGGERLLESLKQGWGLLLAGAGGAAGVMASCWDHVWAQALIRNCPRQSRVRAGGESEWWINPFWVTLFMKSGLLSAPTPSYANRHCRDGAWVRFIYLESL